MKLDANFPLTIGNKKEISMASTRKLRNVNKRYAKVFEEWIEKDETPPKKNRTRVSSYLLLSLLLFDSFLYIRLLLHWVENHHNI